MHDHDPDLIMSLAEETLDAGAAASAEAELAGCERCTADLALQRASLAATTSAPRAWLTELESARLRRALRTELDLVTAPAPVPRRRFLPVAVLGGAAAVLLAVVLALPALENLGGSDEDTVAFATTTTTATTENAAGAITAAPTAPALEAAPAPADAPTEDAAAGADEAFGRAQSTPTTAAAATTAAPEGTIVLALTVADEAGLEAIRETWIAEGGDPALTFFALESEYESTIAAASRYAACGDAGIATIPEATEYVTLGVGEFEGDEAVFLGYLTDPIEDGVVIAHGVQSCEVLATAP